MLHSWGQSSLAWIICSSLCKLNDVETNLTLTNFISDEIVLFQLVSGLQKCSLANLQMHYDMISLETACPAILETMLVKCFTDSLRYNCCFFWDLSNVFLIIIPTTLLAVWLEIFWETLDKGKFTVKPWFFYL